MSESTSSHKTVVDENNALLESVMIFKNVNVFENAPRQRLSASLEFLIVLELRVCGCLLFRRFLYEYPGLLDPFLTELYCIGA